MPEYYQPEPKQRNQPKARAKDHESYGSMTFITFLMPFVGFILGIVYLTKSDRVDRKLGEHLLTASILASLIWFLLFIVLRAMSAPAYY